MERALVAPKDEGRPLRRARLALQRRKESPPRQRRVKKKKNRVRAVGEPGSDMEIDAITCLQDSVVEPQPRSILKKATTGGKKAEVEKPQRRER